MTDSAAVENMRDALRLPHFLWAWRNLIYCGSQSYMGAVRHYAAEWSAEEKVRRFLTDEARRGVAVATQNQALNALVFFYQAVLGKPLGKIEAARTVLQAHVRVALGVAETRMLLGAVEDLAGYPTRLVAHLLYGAGLRVSEPLELRLKDVDVVGRRLVIRGAKGGKDRLVELPRALAGGAGWPDAAGQNGLAG